MKDKSVGSSLAPSVPRLPAPAQAAGLSPPHRVVRHFWQSQGRQRSLRTDPAASSPAGRLASLCGPQPSCAHLVPICLERFHEKRHQSSVWGQLCDAPLGMLAVFGGLKGYSGGDNRTPQVAFTGKTCSFFKAFKVRACMQWVSLKEGRYVISKPIPLLYKNRIGSYKP